jgi:hypothetical protein
MHSKEKSGKDGRDFLGSGVHATLGEKALGKQPKWEGDGSNRQQMPDHTSMKTIEQDSGTQKHHPAKRAQRKQMRFLPDAGRGE